MTILDALRDRDLFGGLPRYRDLSTWAAWLTMLKAVFALPMEEAERSLYESCTGRADPPTTPADEVAAIVGRRGGKSHIAAVLALYLALLVDWRPYLTAGERAHVLIIGPSMRPARRTLLGYVRGMVQAIPAFAQQVEADRQDELDFRCGTTVGVWPAGFGGRMTRGLTVAGAILDEVDYFFQDGPHQAEEVVGAVRPAMQTMPGARLIAISSPYTPLGWLHGFHRDHWAQDDGTLVWKAPSLVMNPTLPAGRIARAIAEDPERGRAEWEAEWRAGVSAFLDPALVEACARREPVVLPPQRGTDYRGSLDATGAGTREDADEFTWSIAHAVGDGDTRRVVVDLVAGRGGRGRRLDLDATVRECSEDFRRYGISTGQADKYGRGWVIEAFARHGVRIEQSARPRSEHYLDLLPLVTMGRLELPDDRELLKQAKLLERRPGAQGKDQVEHPRGGHDDRINSAALAVTAALAGPSLIAPPEGDPHPFGPVRGSRWREGRGGGWGDGTDDDGDSYHQGARDYPGR